METDGDDIGGTYGQMMRDRNGQPAKDSIVAVLYDTDVALNVDCIRHPTSCSNSWSKTEWEKKKRPEAMEFADAFSLEAAGKKPKNIWPSLPVTLICCLSFGRLSISLCCTAILATSFCLPAGERSASNPHPTP